MEPANTLDALMLKTIIKESVREVMREEWFKFFEMLIPYVDDIEATFNPVDYKDDGFLDITDWFNREDQDQYSCWQNASYQLFLKSARRQKKSLFMRLTLEAIFTIN